MLADKRPDGNEARLLVNVAITRVRHKLIPVENRKYIRDSYSHDPVLCWVINIFSERGYVIPSETIDDNFQVDNFEKWVVDLAEPAAFVAELDGSIYSEKKF